MKTTSIDELYQFLKKEEQSSESSYEYSDKELEDATKLADAIIDDYNDGGVEYDEFFNPIDVEDGYNLEDFGLDEEELSKAEDEKQNIATKQPSSGSFISSQTHIPDNAVYVKDRAAPKGTPTYQGPKGGEYWIERLGEGDALGIHGDEKTKQEILDFRKFVTNDGKKRARYATFKPRYEPKGGLLDLKVPTYKVDLDKDTKPSDIPWEIVLNASAGTTETGKPRNLVPKNATAIYISTDSRAPIQAMYKKKGVKKMQLIFSSEYLHEKQAKNYADHKKDIPKIRELADKLAEKPISDLTEEEKVISIASHMPIRHGSEKNIEGETGVGLLSLRKKHVQMIGDTARLDFIGKGNVPQTYNTSDPRMVEIITNALEGKGDDDRIFNTTQDKNNRYIKNSTESKTAHVHNYRHEAATKAAEISVEEFNKAGESMTLVEAQKIIGESAAKLLGHKKETKKGSGDYETDSTSTWAPYIHPEVIHGVDRNLITDWEENISKSWITNPRGSTDSKRKGKIYKENGGGGGGGAGAATSGSFGDGGGTVFTSTNSGIFSPTYGGGGARRKKKRKKRTGIERLGLFVNNKSPQKKMMKSTDFTLELVEWVREALVKDEAKFRQQSSGETINSQTKEIEGRKNPVEFDAETDKLAAVEQNDMERKIRMLDDNEDLKDNKPDEKGDASQTAPAGVEIQLGMTSSYGSGSEKGPLVTGGFRDEERGEVEEMEEDDKESPFV